MAPASVFNQVFTVTDAQPQMKSNTLS